ncbi:acyl transferase [Flaviaesturariibacter amylovorans]|uniref:acyl transferase n=1 Tax=Flaviaesturariibacter amylovorans TaxID=1084520 RepID=UPI0031EFF68C
MEIGPDGFEAAALDLYQFQYAHNPLYGRFCDLLGRRVQELASIPFLPISFFKTHAVQTGTFEPALRFESSGTTGATTSRHLVKDAALYAAVAEAAFERIYGPLGEWCILALLPSYLERGNSSLVHMVQHFSERSGHPGNGFFLYDQAALCDQLRELNAAGQKTLLIGVTYALLDFAEAHPMPLPHTVVMETGGMKGRREEWVRPEVHARLKEAFGLQGIHSEYGMTELLSQAYAPEEGLFVAPPWMRVLVADEDDPASLTPAVSRPRTGRLHVIDLANRWSCAFIATEDIGRQHPDGRFEVLGRMDHSDVRGCSLLAV